MCYNMYGSLTVSDFLSLERMWVMWSHQAADKNLAKSLRASRPETLRLRSGCCKGVDFWTSGNPEEGVCLVGR